MNKSIFYFLTLFLLVFVNQLEAYLDPNSGTGLIAFLVAIFAGIAFYAKKIFYALRRFFTGKSAPKESSAEESALQESEEKKEDK